MNKLKIILTKGLPASGKSTWARELIDKNPEQYKRVNKDDLRSMIDNGKWSKKNETFIKEIRNSIVKSSLSKGYSVIVDDTNLDDSHLKAMQLIATEFNLLHQAIGAVTNNKAWEVIVEEKDFTDVPLDVCIERDKNRTAKVGEKVIRGFYNQYLKKEPIKPPRIEGGVDAIIVDIDGTLALKCDRDIFDYSKIQGDYVNMPVKKVVDAVMLDHIMAVIICSGRDDNCKKETKEWLEDNDILYDFIYMRKTGDKRKDAIVKQEIYDEHIKGKYNILAVFDDRDQVVEMWRKNGLPVFQVADGAF